MTLRRHLLEQRAGGYDALEGASGEENDRLETLPAAFEDGSWTVDDIEWIVRWKSSRSLGYFRQNTPAEITACVERGLGAKSISQKLRILTKLDGVAVRVASAMLLFMNPDRFTVLDWRAWRVLHETGYLPDEFPADPDVEAYLVFLGACWALANEYDVSLRTLDRVLWSLGGDD